jgi:hypothetical protein
MTSRFPLFFLAKSQLLTGFFARLRCLRFHGFFVRGGFMITVGVDFSHIRRWGILHTCQNFSFISLAGLFRLHVL